MAMNAQKNQHPQAASPWSLAQTPAYENWRATRLEQLAAAQGAGFVAVRNLANPSESERAELVRRCRTTNMALYQSDEDFADQEKLRDSLQAFSHAMGLQIAENHRSADPDGIVALRVTDAPAQRGYIPYSRKPMNWHTDGYYNPPEQKIRAMVLHCAVPAGDGGQNQFLDPELAYIRLRDQNPDHIAALMRPDAMTIPENIEPDGSVRPVSTGPVFAVESDGTLSMRYTARTRSILWNDTPATQAAAAALLSVLAANDPLMQTVTFAAGQGVLCNNVLHNRTGFDPDTTAASDRLVFRIRFHNRIKGS